MEKLPLCGLFSVEPLLVRQIPCRRRLGLLALEFRIADLATIVFLGSLQHLDTILVYKVHIGIPCCLIGNEVSIGHALLQSEHAAFLGLLAASLDFGM